MCAVHGFGTLEKVAAKPVASIAAQLGASELHVALSVTVAVV